ncbi:hypothetical protein AB0M34_17935 [Nocardia sp. NPDC050193]
MRLGIFDAPGGTSGHPAQQALVAGHDGRAVVRDPAGPPGVDRPGLHVHTGDTVPTGATMVPDVSGPASAHPDAAVPIALAEPAAIGHPIAPGY